ncbi:cytochrome P450, family 71, subfamily B, polypeptide 17 [Actinidia rufa]|uniref:Cytochrome P450, family 71, subfamily B, polypeptide 17 n=1 Tax=Actinidia rufa TaxID=165716 RepID=A0A7J0EKD3_9ERIC|nr:cytochrome P450, family 71, subfamily B, polypeptide 17 [Actinidia rufa]
MWDASNRVPHLRPPCHVFSIEWQVRRPSTITELVALDPSGGCLSPNPLDRGKTSLWNLAKSSPLSSPEPPSEYSYELAQSQSAVSSSLVGEVPVLIFLEPLNMDWFLDSYGTRPIRIMDTPSAATIVWAMKALIKVPAVLKKVQEEVRNSVGRKAKVDKDDIQSLPYLKAMIKETLRLYPPAPLLAPRDTTQRCVIDEYEIRPQTLVYINAWAIARDPEAWENPEEFLPERFFGSDIDFRGQDFGLIPFGAGRRGFPGINLGVAIVELVLAKLLYSFDWDLPYGMKKEDVDADA